jgi:hypothetical protein
MVCGPVSRATDGLRAEPRRWRADRRASDVRGGGPRSRSCGRLCHQGLHVDIPGVRFDDGLVHVGRGRRPSAAGRNHRVAGDRGGPRPAGPSACVQSDAEDASPDGCHFQVHGVAGTGFEVEQGVICPGPVRRVDLQDERRNLLGDRAVGRYRLNVLEHRVGGPARRERDGAKWHPYSVQHPPQQATEFSAPARLSWCFPAAAQGWGRQRTQGDADEAAAAAFGRGHAPRCPETPGRFTCRCCQFITAGLRASADEWLLKQWTFLFGMHDSGSAPAHGLISVDAAGQCPLQPSWPTDRAAARGGGGLASPCRSSRW